MSDPEVKGEEKALPDCVIVMVDCFTAGVVVVVLRGKDLRRVVVLAALVSRQVCGGGGGGPALVP